MSGSLSRFSGKRRIVAAAIASLAVVAVVAAGLFMSFHPTTAHGQGAGLCTPNTPICTASGGGAYADFQSVGSDGCALTEVVISPDASLSRPGVTASQSVLVAISKYDICTGEQIEDGSNDVQGIDNFPFTGSVAFGPNLSTGSVNGTAPIYDLNTSQFLFTATINVTWQGYGVTTRNLDSSHLFTQGLVMNRHINGDSRQAEATGVFTDETGTNAITGPTLNAGVFSSTGSQVIIFKP